METWRAAVPRSRWWTDANTVSRLRQSVALQGIGQQWQPAVATLIAGDLEGCGPSQPLVDSQVVLRGISPMICDVLFRRGHRHP